MELFGDGARFVEGFQGEELAIAVLRIFEARVEFDSDGSVDDEEWNDVLIPHKPVDLVGSLLGFRLTDIDDGACRRSWVCYIVESVDSDQSAFRLGG